VPRNKKYYLEITVAAARSPPGDRHAACGERRRRATGEGKSRKQAVELGGFGGQKKVRMLIFLQHD
jgi:hypothetical protein